MANGPDPNVQMDQANAKTTQAQATLEAAKNRLTTTQDGFLKTQDNFLKASKLLLEQQNRMTEIQGALTQLNQSKLSLTEIKAVLEHCILLIVNVKKNITNLCTFFQAMSVTVEAVVKHTISGFLKLIAGSVGGGNDMQVFRVGQYTLDDLQRSILFQAAVTIRGYFSLFGDIASMVSQSPDL
jgi:multidrug efflux pump subunit AcrA (membrane-fusion protein)